MGKREGSAVVGGLLLAVGIPATARATDPATAGAASAGWSELTPLVPAKPFDNVRYPHTDGVWNVTFIADEASCDAQDSTHGI